MKIKTKLIFPAALAAALLTLSRANAVTADATMPAVATNSSTADWTLASGTNSTATDTNVNPVASMASIFGDPVIAKGNGFEIKQSQLDEVVTAIKARAAAQGQAIPPEQLMQYQLMTLNDLIGTKLLLQKATDADKAEGEKKADDQIAAFVKQSGSQEAFDRELKASGTTIDELRSKAAQHFTAALALTRELGTSIADSAVKDFYAAHPEDFEQPETVHVRHILLLTMDPATHAPLPDDQVQAKKKQILAILKRARAGEDFATLATQYSEDPGSKDNGGELPPFAKASVDPSHAMVPEFESAAFALATNQISDVVTTSYGFHIIKLLDKTTAKTLKLTDVVPMTTATVADKIKDYLTQQQTDKHAPAFLEKLKKAADVEILDPDLKAAAAEMEVEAAAMATETNAPVVPPVK